MRVGRDGHPGEEDTVSSDSATDATDLIEEAEAEAAEAEAVAAAARARAHAMRLRRRTLAEPQVVADSADMTESDAAATQLNDGDTADEPDAEDTGQSRAMEVLRPTLWAGSLDKIMAKRKRQSPEQVVRKLMTAG
jgi:Mce-associated membrane protein